MCPSRAFCLPVLCGGEHRRSPSSLLSHFLCPLLLSRGAAGWLSCFGKGTQAWSQVPRQPRLLRACGLAPCENDSSANGGGGGRHSPEAERGSHMGQTGRERLSHMLRVPRRPSTPFPTPALPDTHGRSVGQARSWLPTEVRESGGPGSLRPALGLQFHQKSLLSPHGLGLRELVTRACLYQQLLTSDFRLGHGSPASPCARSAGLLTALPLNALLLLLALAGGSGGEGTVPHTEVL